MSACLGSAAGAGRARRVMQSLALLLVVALAGGVARLRGHDLEVWTADLTLADQSRLELTLAVEPALRDCRLASQDDRRSDWACAGYSLEVTSRTDAGAEVVRFDLRRLNGSSFDVRRYGARVSVARATEDAVWSSNHIPWRGMRETTPISQPFEVDTSANRGIPFALVVDGAGRNRVALGLLGQDRSAELRGGSAEDDTSYTLALTGVEPFRARHLSDMFYVSRAARSWFETAQDYTRVVDQSRGYSPLPVPAIAYNPTYDPWYWASDRIDADLVWSLATRTRTLGFASYLIDAGWDIPAGEYPLFLDGTTGDYNPPAATFPDFPGLVKRIQNELGMRVMLWMQQYTLGRRSVYYPELSGALSYALDAMTGEMAETAALCPRVSSTRAHLTRLFQRVAGDYNPDAFWFDWQENIPARCTAGHAHDTEFGDGYRASQIAALDVVRALNPDTLVEMRWPFANLYNKPYAQLWQPLDMPGDFETMRLQAMAMRAFSAGVVIGTDEMYWDPGIPDSEAARFMATVVFSGVPYFGPDLTRESAARAEMLAAWIDFYRQNQQELTRGEFRPYGDQNHPDQVIEGRETAFVYYANPSPEAVELRNAVDRIHIVNASTDDRVDLCIAGAPGVFLAEVSDLFLRPGPAPASLVLKGNDRLKVAVPVGCLLTLTRQPLDARK